jgi:hypothetical protein
MSTGTDAEKNEALFLQFVMSLMQSGMMQLGKVINPMTQKIEKDLRGAEATIEMLVMLRSKTEGNLTKTEEDFLTNAISSLQMNYVDELESEKKQEQEPAETPPEEPGAEEAPTGDDTEKSD